MTARRAAPLPGESRRLMLPGYARDARREAQGIARAGAGQVSRVNRRDPAGLSLREAVGELLGKFPRALEAEAVRAREVVRSRGREGAGGPSPWKNPAAFTLVIRQRMRRGGEMKPSDRTRGEQKRMSPRFPPPPNYGLRCVCGLLTSYLASLWRLHYCARLGAFWRGMLCCSLPAFLPPLLSSAALGCSLWSVPALLAQVGLRDIRCP